ncbi:MAG TPA: type II toxin-antitoxin system RelE/ParE family toxin [Hyphomicrobiaceae bacterium]|jgi:toxin ParE1/3/4
MSNYKLSRRARGDLAEIWRYSNLHWGSKRADRYIDAIRAACGKLAAKPSLGRPLPDAPSDFRQCRCGSHVIVHRQRGEQIYIVRVLHESMNHKEHLG